DGGEHQPALPDDLGLALASGDERRVEQLQPAADTGLRAAVRLPLRLAEVSLQAAFVREGAVRAGAPATAQRRARLVLKVEGDPLEADVAARHFDGAPQDLVERLTASELLS